MRRKLKQRIKKPKIDPIKQSKPLKANLQGLYCVRAIGQRYRIIFDVSEERAVVRIRFVGIRKEGDKSDIYKLAGRLLAKLSPRRR